MSNVRSMGHRSRGETRNRSPVNRGSVHRTGLPETFVLLGIVPRTSLQGRTKSPRRYGRKKSRSPHTLPIKQIYTGPWNGHKDSRHGPETFPNCTDEGSGPVLDVGSLSTVQRLARTRGVRKGSGKEHNRTGVSGVRDLGPYWSPGNE